MALIINKDNKLKLWKHSQKAKQNLGLLMETSSFKGTLGLYSFKNGSIKAIELKTWAKDHSPNLNLALLLLNPAHLSFWP